MIKKFLTVCAGIVLTGGFAFGIDVNGVYSASSNGQNVSVTLSSQDGMVRGLVNVNGSSLPLVGREANGMIQGVWRTPDGQQVPFAAAAGPEGLQLQTNGMTYSLSRGEGSRSGAEMNPQTGRQPMQGAVGQNEAPADMAPGMQMQLEPHQGRVMQANVPAGWSFVESTNGVDITSPDTLTQMSHTYLRGVGRTNPDLFLQNNIRQWAQWGYGNVQVISCKDLGPGSKLWELQHTIHDRQFHSKVQVTVKPSPGGFFAEMIIIRTTPENFEQAAPMLIAIAKSVRVLNNGAFCDNAKIDGEIRKQINIQVQTTRDVAAIRNAGVAYQSHVRDEINQGSDDYIRSQTRFDDAGGNQYTAPLQAERVFKHADGSTSYSTNLYDPVPPGATELTPHRLAR